MTNSEKLDVMLGGRPIGARTPHEIFRGSDDAFWLWANTEGYRQRHELRAILPSMPDDTLQAKPIGASGDNAIQQGFLIYQTYKQLIEQYLGPIDQVGDILDFGSGWGRMLRLFLRDADHNRLWGTDVNEHFVKISRETNKWCNFASNGALPPTSFADASFDVIYSFSVFSHLGETISEKWLKETRRLLRPGGIVIASTWHRGFIEWCADARKGLVPVHPEWRENLSVIFLDTESWLRRYDLGEFCFEPYASERHPRAFIDGVPAHGEACIPEAYVRRKWSEMFDILEFVDDRKKCPQNIVVMRK